MANWTERMRAPIRELRLGGRIVFGSGQEIALTGELVSSLTIEEGADGELAAGSVLSARCTLDLVNDAGQWSAGGALLGGRVLSGATILPELGAAGEDGVLWRPLGAFQVESAHYLETEACLRVQAVDSAGYELAERFEDELSYPATLEAIWRHAVGQTRYAWSGSVPNGAAVVDAAPDWKEASLRGAMGSIAMAAGCFVCIGRSGELELRPLWAGDGGARVIDAERYFKLERGDAVYGPVDALRLTPADGAEERQYRTSAGTALFAMKVSGNPLFRAEAAEMDELARGMLGAVAGYRSANLRFEWRGDPELRVGDCVRVKDLSGGDHFGVVSRQTLRFSNGFSMTCSCATPEGADSGVRRALTPEGGLNAAALTGAVDGALLSVGSVTAGKIAAGAITAEKLEAGSVDAHIVSAVTGRFGEVTAENVETDSLGAELARIGRIVSRAADVDWAHIKDLTTDTAIITEGVGGKLMISRLAVTEANMVSLTTGELVVKGADGRFYSVCVDAEGNVTAAVKQIGNADVLDLSINAGEKLIEGSVTTACLNATEIFADSEVVRELIAANLKAETLFAQTGFLEQLRTSHIFGGKSLEMIAGEATDAKDTADDLAKMQTWVGVEPPPAPIEAGRQWIDQGVAPWVLRTWIGADVSTDREDSGSASGKLVNIVDKGEVQSYDGISLELQPIQAGSGAPYPPGGGKNLCPTFTTQTSYGVTFTVGADGSVTVTGTAASTTLPSVYLSELITLPAGTYTVSGAPVGSSNGHFDMLVQIKDKSDIIARSYNGSTAATFTLAQTTQLYVHIRVSNGDSGAGKVFRPQIEAGTTATAYAPYSNIRPISGRTSAQIARCGKNLCPTFTTQTASGVTFTVGADGSVSVTGTAASTTLPSVYLSILMALPAGTYTVSGAPEGSSNGHFDMLVQIKDKSDIIARAYDGSTAASFTLAQDTQVYVHLRVQNGDAGAGKVFRPQIEVGTTATDYEPYRADTYTANFGRTIYGGHIDWQPSGSFTSEYALATLDGSDDEGWNVWTSGNGSKYFSTNRTVLHEIDKPGDKTIRGLCSWTSSNANGIINGITRSVVDQGTIEVSTGAIASWGIASGDLAAFKAKLAANPMQILYKLETPVTGVLSAPQIAPLGWNPSGIPSLPEGRPPTAQSEIEARRLDGDNVLLYTDADDMTVNYTWSGWRVVNDTSEIERVLGEASLTARAASDEAQAAAKNLERRIRLNGEGLHVGDSDSSNELLLQSEAIHFVIGGERVSTIAPNYHRMGGMEIRTPSVGGIVIQAVGGSGAQS